MSKKGVDVSKNNGTVNWDAVVKAGYGDFAIIRCGYGSDLKKQDDTKFAENVKKCEALGIPYGVYLYSYALNTADAESEAAHALRLLKQVGKNFKYGVWFDMEDADNYKKRNGMPSNDTLVDICYTFCNIVESKGYYTGIYASKSWLDNQLKSSKLDRFDKWVAQWNDTGCTYTGSYSIWQYTSDLKIGGKRFDANKLIRDFATGVKPEPSNKPAPSTPSKKSNETIADEVIAGKWGNQPERQKKLEAAGYNYETIRNLVNAKYEVNTKPSISYYKKYTGGSVSIVDALKAIGADSSKANRARIAKANGISNYKGTAVQNNKLLSLLKQGKLKK